MKRAILALLLTLGCAACASTAHQDLTWPTASQLVPGVTTEAQILAEYGQPDARATTTDTYDASQNAQATGTVFDVPPVPGSSTFLSYSARGAWGPLLGRPAASRALFLRIWNGTLVSYAYVSNFDADTTDFDPARANQLVRGGSTEADANRMLGTPSGRAVYPSVHDPNTDAFIYQYAKPEGRQIFQKRLELVFGVDGKLIDYRLTNNLVDLGPLPPLRVFVY